MRSPFKEVLIGTALGLMVTLAIAGVDITPLVVLSGIAVAFKPHGRRKAGAKSVGDGEQGG